MTQTEPTLTYDASGDLKGISVKIDMDTPNPGQPEPSTGTQTEPSTTEAPSSLELAPPADPARPTYLPAKFKTNEELAAAYAELERKLGQPAAQAPEKPADPVKAAQAAATAAGLTDAELTAYANEVNASGKLSDASYTALAAKGLPKGLVDSHVAGLQAIRQGVMDRALGVVGGAEGYKQVSEWARANLDEGSQKQYNADVNSGDPARVQYAVEGLKARHDAATGSTSTRIHGRRGPSATGFQTKAQQVAAQSDPRYWSDPGFRQEVERQIAASNY